MATNGRTNSAKALGTGAGRSGAALLGSAEAVLSIILDVEIFHQTRKPFYLGRIVKIKASTKFYPSPASYPL